MRKNILSMSTLIILFILNISLTACASTPTVVDKKFRYYDPCPAVYCVQYNNWSNKCQTEANIENYSQMYCFEYCSEKSIFGNCQKYSMDVVSPNDAELRSMGFRLQIPQR